MKNLIFPVLLLLMSAVPCAVQAQGSLEQMRMKTNNFTKASPEISRMMNRMYKHMFEVNGRLYTIENQDTVWIKSADVTVSSVQDSSLSRTFTPNEYWSLSDDVTFFVWLESENKLKNTELKVMIKKEGYEPCAVQAQPKVEPGKYGRCERVRLGNVFLRKK